MFLKCDKKLLADNINLVQKAIPGRTSMPILECFLLVCDDSGFRMTATDLEIGIKTFNIECEIIKHGTIALPSRFFADIIRKLPDGIVSIEVKEKFITIIKCLDSEFKIVGKSTEEFPEIPDVERDKEFRTNQSSFKNLIRQTIFSICQDESKPNLMGALIEIENNGINMVSCDSYRVSFRHEESTADGGSTGVKENVIVPSKTINELSKLITDAGELSIFITSKHILFDIGSCTVTSRLIDGEFVNYVNIFPNQFETKIVVDKVILADALDRATLVSYQENRKNPVRMSISENKLVVTTATETGNSYDVIEVDQSGSDLEISFNPKFLLEPVRTVDDISLSIEFNTPLSPCVIKPVEEDNYKFLVLPLRLKN